MNRRRHDDRRWNRAALWLVFVALAYFWSRM